jgi:serine/threonine protein phosphatase PrpC
MGLMDQNEFQIQAWVGSDTGQVRKKNEDNYLVDALNGLFIVADGMGGGVDGEKASRRAIEVFSVTIYQHRELLRKYASRPSEELQEKVRQSLKHAVEKANDEIMAVRREMGPDTIMGTTLSVLLLIGHIGVVAHVGDSRIYLLRHRRLSQVTVDHSLVAEQVREGLITEEQAQYSPFRNVLLQAIGRDNAVESQVDFFPVEIGDQFLLCSDGLHSYLQDDEIIAVLAEPAGHRIVPRLIDIANARGGSDNITAIAVRLSSPEHYIATKQVDVQRDFSSTPLLRGLKPQETAQILQIGQPQDFIAGERIVVEDAGDRSMFLIFDGQVGIYRNSEWLRTLESGQHFGLHALVDGKGRVATAIAETQVRLLELGRNDVLELLRAYPALGMKVIWNLLKDLSNLHREDIQRLLVHLPPSQDP